MYSLNDPDVIENRRENDLLKLKLHILFGSALKTIGYMLIAAGIFLSLKDKLSAIKVVQLGVFLVISGWLIIIRYLLIARKLKPSQTCRLSAHISCGALGIKEGEIFEIKGNVRRYVNNAWKTAEGFVHIFIDGKSVGKVNLKDGSFSLPISLKAGRYRVLIVYGSSTKTLNLNVLSEKLWKKNVRIFLATIAAIALIVILTSFPLLKLL